MNPTTPNDTNEVAAEVLPPSAIMALERASIDAQVATAHAYPRSIEIFKRRALSMATLDVETAESCMYCRPVGKEQNDQGKWVEKYAEGASIRLAEIVATSYGNLRVAARIIEQTERFVRCEGVCHDLESNYAGRSEGVESTVTRDGRPYSERQRALIAKVCLAKSYRDAIFKVVPRALCKPVYEAAKKVASGAGQTIDKRRAKVKEWLTSRKVDEARMFAALGVKGWTDIGEDQLVTLTGLKTAIMDGDVSLDEAFPPVVKGAEAASGAHRSAQAEPKTEKGVQTPPKAPEAAPEAKKEAGEDNLDFGSNGNDGQGSAPEAQPELAQTKPAGKAKPDESADAIASVRLLLKQNEIEEQAFMVWAEANKLSRKGQTIEQIGTGKLIKIVQNFHKFLPELKPAQ